MKKLSAADLTTLRAGFCPRCNCFNSLRSGPRSGDDQNILCTCCFVEFNVGINFCEVIAEKCPGERMKNIYHVNLHGFKSPTAVVTLAKPGSECVMVLTECKRAIAAILIPQEIHIGQIEYCYALGQGHFIEAPKLAAMWQCWAVLCLPGWGIHHAETRAPRPTGQKFFFVS